MEGQAEPELERATLDAAGVERAHAAARLDGRLYREAPGSRRIQAEDRQHAAAPELQPLAAMLLDRRRHDVEILIQPLDNVVAGPLLGDPGEAAQVAVP